MLRIFLAASVIALSQAAITDLNCTDGTLLTANAMNCDNKQNDAFCTAVFGGTPAVEVGKDTDRPDKCWKDATGLNEDVKKGAIGACAKTCGYCCQTPEFTCTNKEFPRITCSAVTSEMCKDVKWRDILAEDCPSVCGFCTAGGCIDTAVKCEVDKSICRNIDMQDFVKENCKRTCGYCDNKNGTTSTTPGYGGNCIDKSSSCAAWVKNNFCTSAFYTEANKREFCARSCNLC